MAEKMPERRQVEMSYKIAAATTDGTQIDLSFGETEWLQWIRGSWKRLFLLD